MQLAPAQRLPFAQSGSATRASARQRWLRGAAREAQGALAAALHLDLVAAVPMALPLLAQAAALQLPLARPLLGAAAGALPAAAAAAGA
jgi:hypothetical protein